MSNDKSLRPHTQVLTRGFDPSLSVGSARPAVFRSSTYVFSSPEAAERAFDLMAGRGKATEGEQVDLVYSRFNHPNAEILEDHLVPIEAGATAALIFNSGMSAIMTAMMTFVRPGDTIVYTVPIYGGTQHLVEDLLTLYGIVGVGVVAGDSVKLDGAIRAAKNLRMVLVETPANPTLIMTDIQQACASAGAAAKPGAPKPIVMVDNTLLGPAFQHPLQHGADLVMYSATKYLSGFSDMIGGVLLAKDPDLIRQIRPKRSLFGTILQPDECWMLDGRLSTVGLRMGRATENAQHIAAALAGHRKLECVVFPTLFEDAEQKRIVEKQCDQPGAMLSLVIKGGKKSAFDFLRTIRIARNAVSLGGVETLICHPKTTTHSGFTEEEFRQAGVVDGLVRVSVGIEDWRDLLADFEQALEAV
jgi:cystathionine beta-lyase/cystathionine gamma-synthase